MTNDRRHDDDDGDGDDDTALFHQNEQRYMKVNVSGFDDKTVNLSCFPTTMANVLVMSPDKHRQSLF